MLEIHTKTLKLENGEIYCATYMVNNRDEIVVKRYSGTFTQPEFAEKAVTRKWYATSIGNPHAVEGKGDTPLAAIRDSLSRTNELVMRMEDIARTMLRVLDDAKGEEPQWASDPRTLEQVVLVPPKRHKHD